MTLRDEIAPYLDSYGLVAPWPAGPNSGEASGNGVCYTSEYYTMLYMLGQSTIQDQIDWANKIDSCINSKGLLERAPVGVDNSLETQDDYFGVLDTTIKFNNTAIPRKFLWAMIKYVGCMNNVNPGIWTVDSFLARFPQMICGLVAASFPSWKNPLHILIRILLFPLFWLNAIFIATGGICDDLTDTDGRRLSWHNIQFLAPFSLTCWLASKIWYRRLYKQFGSTGMKAIASIYYQPQGQHPFAKYWVTE